MNPPRTVVAETARPLGEEPFAPPGEPFMGLYRHHPWRPGQPQTVFPMRVVRDDAHGLVGWLASGTPRLELRDPDGSGPRDVPLAHRFDPDRHANAVAARVRWRGPGILRITPAGRPWSVLVFWTAGPDGSLTFAGWYVNLEDPAQREGVDLVSGDHILDVWIEPDGTTRWKDEDELEAAVEQGRYTSAQAATIRQHGHDAIAEFRSGSWAFDHRWTQWTPPSEWTIPPLPVDATWVLDRLDE